MITGETRAHFSIPSIIAVAAAIASFFVSAAGGFALAVAAIAFGILGILLSMAPSVRGGFVSILSLIAGAVGIIVALVKAFV
jgi:hypothetical protein